MSELVTFTAGEKEAGTVATEGGRNLIFISISPDAKTALAGGKMLRPHLVFFFFSFTVPRIGILAQHGNLAG